MPGPDASGLGLQGTFQDGTTTWRPYLKVNLWHGFDATDWTRFATVALPASFGATSLEVGAGVVATLSENVSLFAVADYTDQRQWSAPRDDRRQSRHADHMVSGPIREDPDRFRRVAERARMTDIEM